MFHIIIGKRLIKVISIDQILFINNSIRRKCSMKKIVSLVLAAVAMVASSAASVGCVFILVDEPNTPKALND